ncbi:ABC transporter permease [Sediminibacillus albus]|uniref:Putative ABC transport system permease protein n=1 Tax=Sediminibacillus albus TaxID=407036 RepID=A0A1G9CTI7_9BACI|nr:iron export ABC transporter permease subunit FetB [Sediminibacillus albus]SDK54966.1 putative ABC transport system permease protein [Sediminibacillus albus]
MAPDISNYSLLFLIIFVLIPLSLSYRYQLGMNKDIVWSTIRGTAQLFFIGYLLNVLFDLRAIIGVPIMVGAMILIASLHARNKGQGLPYVFPAILIGLLLIEASVLALWLIFDMISFKPSEVIPMSGMVIGNSMVAMGLALERIKSEFKENNGRLLAALSLGASPRQAAQIIIQKTLRASLIPNVDGLKTIGLVQLPGMMTGMILGGIEPVMAIKYQLIISISIFSSVSLSAIFITLVVYRFFFNKQAQLVPIKEGQSQ